MHREFLPVERALEGIGAIVNPVIEKYLTSEANPAFAETLMYQIETRRRRLEPMLVMLSAEAAGNKAKAIPAAAAFELAHDIILIIDDIVDKSELRRGAPSTRRRFGQATAILIARKYREAIVRILNQSKHSDELENLVSKVLDNALEDEMLDTSLERAARDEPLFKSFVKKSIVTDNHLQMIKTKTAVLFEGCCRAGAIAADAPKQIEETLASYGLNLGYLFQIRDDVLDIFGVEQEFGKKIGKDSMEHKARNAVILLALQRLSEERKETLLERLAKESTTHEEITDAVNMLRSAGLEEESFAFASKYEDAMEEALSKLPDSEAKSTLEALPEILLRRI